MKSFWLKIIIYMKVHAVYSVLVFIVSSSEILAFFYAHACLIDHLQCIDQDKFEVKC